MSPRVLPLERDWFMHTRAPAKKQIRFAATASIPEIEKAPAFSSVKQVAALLGVSTDTVMELITCKKLAAHGPAAREEGRRVRVHGWFAVSPAAVKEGRQAEAARGKVMLSACNYGAEGRNRTDTPLAEPRILSPGPQFLDTPVKALGCGSSGSSPGFFEGRSEGAKSALFGGAWQSGGIHFGGLAVPATVR